MKYGRSISLVDFSQAISNKLYASLALPVFPVLYALHKEGQAFLSDMALISLTERQENCLIIINYIFLKDLSAVKNFCLTLDRKSEQKEKKILMV